MDKQHEVLQGTLDSMILKAVSLGPFYGSSFCSTSGQSRKTASRFNKALSTRRRTSGALGLDHKGIGRVKEQAQYRVLPPNRGRKARTASGSGRVEAHGTRDRGDLAP